LLELLIKRILSQTFLCDYSSKISINHSFHPPPSTMPPNRQMSVAFWSVQIKSGTEVEVQPPEGYVLNVQQAALESEKGSKGAAYLRVTTTNIAGDEQTSLLCTLRDDRVEQCPLNLVFGYDVPIKFRADGDFKGSLHVLGYYQPGPEEDDEEMDSDDEEDMDEEDMEKYRGMLEAAYGRENEESDEESDSEDSDDESDSEDEKLDSNLVEKMIKKNLKQGSSFPQSSRVSEIKEGKASEDDSEGSDSDSGSNSDSDDDDDSEAEPAPKKPSAPPAKKPQSQPPQQSGKPQGGGNKPAVPKQPFHKGGQQQGGNKQGGGGGGAYKHGGGGGGRGGGGGGGGGGFKQGNKHGGGNFKSGDKRKR